MHLFLSALMDLISQSKKLKDLINRVQYQIFQAPTNVRNIQQRKSVTRKVFGMDRGGHCYRLIRQKQYTTDKLVEYKIITNYTMVQGKKLILHCFFFTFNKFVFFFYWIV